MTEGTKTQNGSRAELRQARLAAQLRSNLKKRKQQLRKRAEVAKPAQGEERGGTVVEPGSRNR